MTLTLKVIDGPHKGKVFQFEHHDTFMVGRASDATFRLSQDDAYFSRNHFLIEFNPPSCRLLDLNSRNGTFVNGQQVTSIDLREGDLIRGGQTTIRVGFGSEANSSARPSLLGAAKTILPQLFSSSVRNQPTIPPTTSRNSPASPAGQASVPATRPSRDSSKTSQTTELPLFTGYRTIREIGRGAMGVVYEAETLDRSKRVAIKAIIPNAAGTAEDISRFLREASILRDLVHPHIVGFREFIESNTDLCIVMDYIEGTNAASVVKKTTQGLSVDKSVRFTIQLLDALHFAHQQGFVHRDVKPANLLVTNLPRECLPGGFRTVAYVLIITVIRFDDDRPNRRNDGVHAARTDHSLSQDQPRR